jgi:hypothetical protein
MYVADVALFATGCGISASYGLFGVFTLAGYLLMYLALRS